MTLKEFLTTHFHSAIPGYYSGHGLSVTMGHTIVIRNSKEQEFNRVFEGNEKEALEYLKGVIK